MFAHNNSQPLIRVIINGDVSIYQGEKLANFIVVVLRALQSELGECLFVLPLDFVKIIGIWTGYIFSDLNVVVDKVLVFNSAARDEESEYNYSFYKSCPFMVIVEITDAVAKIPTLIKEGNIINVKLIDLSKDIVKIADNVGNAELS